MYQEPIAVLIVDDEEMFAQILAEQLAEEYGFQTTFVTGGREAIEALQKARRGFDVVLLDYKMPDVTGLNVLQWMHEQKNETPVVLLTAAGSETVAVEAMKFGAYDYLRKENVDLPRIALVMQATHERHQFRIARIMEEERWKEIGLNNQATDKVRDVLNAIGPKINETFAAISYTVDNDAESALAKLPEHEREAFKKIFGEIQKQVGWIEIGVRGLLSLYRILYARHTEVKEIEQIKSEMEKKVSDGK
ncbi:MAG: response regulator [Ignavibacteriae bacterium]|nr:response regulator [Ignavibacteriota bacterium]